MQPIRIIWVGKSQQRFVAEGIDYYRRQLAPLQPVEVVEVRPAVHSGRDPKKSLLREGEAILKRIAPGEIMLLCDEKGRQLTTREWAHLMRRLRDQEGRPVALVIGGAFGVDESVRKRADQVLALSRLTFPHQLVRLVLMEQLYRVFSLLAGHHYHHE